MKTFLELSPPPSEANLVDPVAARLRVLLSGPVLPTMPRLALSTVVVLFVQTFVSFLGTNILEKGHVGFSPSFC